MEKQHNAGISALQKEMAEIKHSQHGYVESFSKDLEKIKDLAKEFEKALRTFQNHTQLYDSITQNCIMRLKEHTLPLKDVVNEFNALKPEAKKIESFGLANQGIAKQCCCAGH